MGSTYRNLELEWTTKSPVLVGSGDDSPEYDMPTIRLAYQGEDTPYIPGSSIKGVLRHAIERELRSNGIPVCDSSNPRHSCAGIKKREISSLQRKGDNETLRDLVKGFCPACIIFGSHGFKGRVRFLDAYPATDKHGNLDFATGGRPGIAIDRRSGGTMRGALWQIEYIAEESRFRSKILTENLEDEYFALLMKAILSFNQEQLKVGALTTKGFGRMSVSVLSSEERKLSLLKERSDSDFPTSNKTNDSEKLTKNIKQWAHRIWAEYISTKFTETKGIEEPKIANHGRGDGRKYVSVIHREATDRTIIDRKMSGVINFFMVPRPGYYLFVGSGSESLPYRDVDDQLRRQIEDQVDFSNVLHIAKGLNMKQLEPYQSFARVLRFGTKNQPVIPGSTLKGAFRSRIEHSFKPHEGEVNACFIKQSRHVGRNASSSHLHLYGENGQIPERENCNDISNPCVVCDMFGMTSRKGGLKGLVEVHDARLIRGVLKPIEVDAGHGTARLLAVGKDKDDDSPSPIFRGIIRYTNLTKARLGLLFVGMAAFSQRRLRLGRFKYRGKSDSTFRFGQLSVAVKRIAFDDERSIVSKDKVKDFITSCRREAVKEFGNGSDITTRKKRGVE